MPSNNSGKECAKLFRRFPSDLAHLHSADSFREPKWGIRWALDNGVYGAWSSGRPWDKWPFYRFLGEHCEHEPLWVVVPDAIGDRDETLRKWDEHYPKLAEFGVPLAFAAQDGMCPKDVPQEASIVFVGGTTDWKWGSLDTWTKNFPRVHVGRVNSIRLLKKAEKAGAESCDGTGWFRHPKRTRELESYLETQNYIV